MILFLTTITLFASPQFCSEVSYELNEAVKRGQIEQSVADDLSDRCLQTYTRGA